jgi:hypothetical protein
VPRLARTLAVLLLAGTALHGVAAAFHPMLAGDAAAQLAVIAGTPYWRTLHLVMLAGSALIVAGVWARLLDDRSPSSPAPLIAALAIVSVGICINALNTAYMTGAGWRMAALWQAGRVEMAPLFEATHPIGLMAARFGNGLVALGALALGFAERQEPAQPRWIAWLAWAAAAGGFVGVLFFDESSRIALAAVALLSGWQVAVAVRALRPAPAAPADTLSRRAAPRPAPRA